MDIPPSQLQAILALYEEGQLLKAHALAQPLGPLHKWDGTAARVLAGRLATHLGAPRLGRALHWLAWRKAPQDPQALYYHARGLFDRRGPLPAWQFMEAAGDLPDAPAEYRADWLSARAMIAGWMRDFETAEAWLARADALSPSSPWLCIERAALLDRQDRYPEALAAARRSMELRPWYRPGVQAAAHLLQLLGRDGEALELLEEATGKNESASTVAQLAALQTELKQHDKARANWERVAALAPLMEKGYAKFLAARRADAAYDCGDWAAAAEWGRQSDSEFHKGMAEKLTQTQGQGKRVALPVGFVRQHHMTCAPATLSALGRYWKAAVDHLPVADEICYDGTSAHGERSWAMKNGWVAREFTVTWETAVALLDRGIPFTLTTVEATSGHLQAVIGYDSLRGTLIIRDPYERNSGEFLCGPLCERYRSSGPRGMAMVPADKASRLDGIDLPDAALYDLAFAVNDALVGHRRAEAEAALAKLSASAPDHRLTLHARRAMAAYDSNTAEALECIEKLLATFPDDGNLLLNKLSCLRVLGRREQRVALLREAIAKKHVDPVFWSQLAMELREDAREHPEAIRLLRRAVRYRRYDASNYHALAGILWDQCRRDETLPLYRWAMCLEDKQEGLARSYFIACRHFNKTDEALRLMRDRFKRFGARSAGPGRTLFWACEELNKTEEGFAALDEALAKRPDDEELLLYSAHVAARYGRLGRAVELLERAKGKSQATNWCRAAAQVAVMRGEPREALALYRKVLDAEPLALDAHHRLSQLLAETEGRAPALEHLQKFGERFPHSYPLHQLWIERLRGEAPEKAEPVIRKISEIHPADAWTRRELTMCLLRQNRVADALEQAETAARLDPASPSSHYCLGRALGAARRMPEACAAHLRAIELSVDADYAISELMRCCDSDEQRREVLSFVRDQLVRQTTFGDAILAFRAAAREILGGDELLARLREAKESRPDLWQAWSAVVRQLVDTGQWDAAHDVAAEATGRFPLIVPLWGDLATVCRARSDRDGEIAALRRALEINPNYSPAARQLAAVYERGGDFAESEAILEKAVVREPLDGANHGSLADTLWRLGQKDAAMTHIRQAVRLEPEYDWAWSCLREWGDAAGQPKAAEEMARELTVRRAGESRSWLVLARTLDGEGPAVHEERLAAVAKAIELDPRMTEAYDLRAEMLAAVGRWDEALAACVPAAFEGTPPDELRGRAAWVLWRQGKGDDAVRLMTRVVAECPNYYWAWCRLAEWHRARENYAGYLEAAEQMAQRWPNSAIALGYRADARCYTKSRIGAKGDLRRAMELAPDYTFAANKLFDLHLEDGEYGPAGRVLEVLRKQSPGDETTSRAAKLAAIASLETPAAAAQVQTQVKADVQSAGTVADYLMELCTGPSRDSGPLERALGVIDATPHKREVENVFRAAAEAGKLNPVVGALWVERVVSAGRWKEGLALVAKLADKGEAGKFAAICFLDNASQGGQARLARKCIRKHRDRFRAENNLWGAAGRALLAMGEPAAAAKWFADWEQRAAVRPWMLRQLTIALRRLGRDARALRVIDAALAMPADELRDYFEVHRAFEDAAAGQTIKAEARLKPIDLSAMEADSQFLARLTDSLVLAARAGAATKHEHALESAKHAIELAEAAQPKFRSRPELYRAYCRTLSLLARAGFSARLWCLWRRAKPLLAA